MKNSSQAVVSNGKMALFKADEFVRESKDQKLDYMRLFYGYEPPIKDSVIEKAFDQFDYGGYNKLNELLTKNVIQTRRNLVELGHFTQQKLGKKAILFSYANQRQSQSNDVDLNNQQEKYEKHDWL